MQEAEKIASRLVSEAEEDYVKAQKKIILEGLVAKEDSYLPTFPLIPIALPNVPKKGPVLVSSFHYRVLIALDVLEYHY